MSTTPSFYDNIKEQLTAISKDVSPSKQVKIERFLEQFKKGKHTTGGWRVFGKKMTAYVESVLRSLGYAVHHTKSFVGCGYEDPWDPCTCRLCSSDKPTRIATITLAEKPVALTTETPETSVETSVVK